MNSTKILHVAVIIGFLLEAVTQYIYFPVGGIGASAQWKNGAASVEASCSPLSVVWAALGILLFALLMLRTQHLQISGTPAWWRRVCAFCIDLYFFGMTAAPIGALVDLGLEARRTGRFAWSFHRNYAVGTDFEVGLPMVFIFMALGFLYFVFPLTRGRQTVGCFLMRTKVVPPFGNEGRFTWRGALWRTWCVLRAIGHWTRLLRPQRDAEGDTWYDLESGCHVVSVKYEVAP